MKKHLRLILIAFVVLLVICFPISINAESAEPYISIDTTSAKPGETVQVDVSFLNNPGICAFALELEYDKTRLLLESIELNSSIDGTMLLEKRIVWANSSDVNYDGVFFTLYFTVLDSAAPGDAEVSISYSNGNICNYMEEDVNFVTTNGMVVIEQDIPTMHRVNITNGTSNVENSVEGNTVTITANAPDTGKRFKEWIIVSGEVSLANPLESTTTFTMPATDVELTATYEDILYGIVVDNGYANTTNSVQGATITITAAEAPDDKQFDKWVVTEGEIILDNNSSEVASFVMPAGDVKITATYKEIIVQTYSITVSNGVSSIGAGTIVTEAVGGAVVTIFANTPEEGKRFKEWVVISGDIILDDYSEQTTTFVMPMSDVEIEATYENAVYQIVVTNGTSDVTEASLNDIVTIIADQPEQGMRFVEWNASSENVIFDNCAGSTTTFKMPADNVQVEAIYEVIPVEIYDIVVTNGTASVGAGNIIVEAVEGTTVTITANAPETGKQFKEWVVVSGNITLADATSDTTTFVMPNECVEIVAEYNSTHAISGSITSYGASNGTVTVRVLKGTTEVAKTTTTNGKYSISSIPSGNYTLEISKLNHVTRTYEVTVNNGALAQDVKICLRGDVNADGKVTTIDAVMANSHAKGVTTLTGYSLSCADVVGTDGKVTTVDFTRINSHARGVNLLW